MSTRKRFVIPVFFLVALPVLMLMACHDLTLSRTQDIAVTIDVKDMFSEVYWGV